VSRAGRSDGEDWLEDTASSLGFCEGSWAMKDSIAMVCEMFLAANVCRALVLWVRDSRRCKDQSSINHCSTTGGNSVCLKRIVRIHLKVSQPVRVPSRGTGAAVTWLEGVNGVKRDRRDVKRDY
jgi:hypothetical protein